jgi:hypothetical protein
MALFDKKKLSMTSAPKAAMSSSAPKLAAAPKTTMSAPKTTMSTMSSPMDMLDRGKGKKKKKGGSSSGRSKNKKTGLLGGGCKGLGAMPGGRGRR